ncbi:MAG: sodium:alanine symporter family protein [gamma proteobacterium symbiont of Lucinoma myriamae]|nr:sodium:alanine symporter family protein [gamma proteobacterium symbiont of Lucinoma myriamae]MCU7817499.1 sodium:alanine symporter family protein [gamma proteobacterium symbiont of Lucinoma myriamae]MCU7831076.1 sodium:alanine symporter family protein [gamma proteobacterium symbiont of Lucinoma myriamae]
MEWVTGIINDINGLVWGKPMLIMIFGTGIFLMLGLRFMPILNLAKGFKLLWAGRDGKNQNDGEISPFNALMTSLSATIGTGNITGVATAIFIGGPGALFWMWVTALIGMATKYAEAVCAVHYREVDEDGSYLGGPMYYIKNGLGKKWLWLAFLFALFGALASFGIGNTVQANSVAHALETQFNIPLWLTAVVLLILTAAVVLGGIKRIAQVAGKLVPFMALAYVAAGLVVLITHFAQIPEALTLIVKSAFNPVAATGGFAGATIMLAVQWGVARGIFSNEAGLGSAPIAHAAAKTNDPVRQGMIAMLGTFIDTIIVCSITGLAIVLTGVWTTGVKGAALTIAAFDQTMPEMGGMIVSIAQAVFAFTTILGWSVYGERCVEYLFGIRSVKIFRILWILAVPVGAMGDLSFIWLLADTLNALMALPNLIALLLLSPVIFKLTVAARNKPSVIS